MGMIEITVGGEEQTPTDEVQIVQDESVDEKTEENQDVTTDEH